MGSRRRAALEGQTPHPEGDRPHEGGLQGVPRTGRRAPPEGPETGLPRGIAGLSQPPSPARPGGAGSSCPAQDRRHPRASGERRPRCLRGSPQGSAASGLLRCRAGRRVPASAPAPGCHRPFDIRDLVSTRFTADTRCPPPIACTCASRQTALTVLAGCSPASRTPGRWAGCAVRRGFARRVKAASVTDSPLHARSRRPRGPSRPGSGGGPRFAGHRPVAVWRRQAPPGGVALARLKSTLPADRRRRFNRPESRGARAPASRRARFRGACPRSGNSRGRTPGRRRRNEGERP